MIRGRALRGFAAVAAVLSIVSHARAGPSGRALVERIRYVGTINYSRVVIDLSTAARYTVQSVPGDGDSTPIGRLVIDIDGARIGPGAREPLNIGGALLQRIRTGQYAPDTGRIVLDFRTSAEHRIVILPDPFRLVIDMRRRHPAEGPAIVRRLDSAARRRASRAPEHPSPPVSTPSVARSSAPEANLGASPRTAAIPVAPMGTAHRPLRVMLDAGHGGKDPGAFGVGGVAEKDVVLAVTRELAAQLRSERDLEILLTRNDDRFLSLEERTALANAADADLFVSIHGNASPHRSMRGVEVYYLNNTNNRGTLRLAAMENGIRWDPEDRSLQEAIPDLSYILSDLRQTYKVEESRVLADSLGKALVARLRDDYDGIAPHQVREGPFYVLVGAYMPCVLVEISYLTHPVEGARLRNREYQRAIADGIFQGIRGYLRETRMAKNL